MAERNFIGSCRVEPGSSLHCSHEPPDIGVATPGNAKYKINKYRTINKIEHPTTTKRTTI